MARLAIPRAEAADAGKVGIYERLKQIMLAWVNRGRRVPAPMPSDLDKAIAWWLDLMPKRKRDEIVQETTYGEIDPYMSRLVSTLCSFLDLQPADRSFVLAAIEDGVEWRGDRPGVFAVIYEETMEAREIGSETYREEAKAKRRGFLAAVRMRTAA